MWWWWGGKCGGRMSFVEWRTLLLLFCVHVVSVRGGGECDQVKEFLVNQFGVDASHVFVGGGGMSDGGSSNGASASQPLCTQQPETTTIPSTPSCCPVSMVDPFLKSSNVIQSTFNNSDQFNRFKTKISEYETLISNHESSNVELWNATIEGLRVLKSWGVKVWDPEYLYRSNVFSDECLRRVVGAVVCGGCSGEGTPAVKPCKSLCHNVVLGCLKFPLAEFAESSWKHAVNSVRTAIRLVITTGGDAKQNTQPLQDLVTDLNDWREPITWWLPDYKRNPSCESLPTSGCWNGATIGKYEFGTATWKSHYNPEFSNLYKGDGGIIQPSVLHELDRFQSELVGVRKSLEKYWPTTNHHQKSPPHALALSSSESISPPRSTYLHDLVPEIGSGDDSFDDDEDIEYSNSGYGPHVPESDDEDLNGYGSGASSGDNGIYPEDPDQIQTGDSNIGKVTDGTTPDSISCGCRFSGGVFVIVGVMLLWVT